MSPQRTPGVGVKIGDCASQAVLETLALLVAVRVWAHIWVKAKARVHIRSDSRAALGALGKVASPVASINSIARELALDVATSTADWSPSRGGTWQGCSTTGRTR